MKFGIMSTGVMAQHMIETMKKMKDVELYAVASRDIKKANEVKELFGFEKAYGSYEELVEDKDVEIIYIATPHSRHYEDMKLCIEHGKAVFCEKAFTLNGREAKKIKELANKHHVFVTEAIWPRYMPSKDIIDEVLASGIIGKVHTLNANLSYNTQMKKRITDPNLAGGALLDVGVYGLTFADMHMKSEIERIETSVRLTDTGVDGDETITIFYKDGSMTVLTHSIYSRSDRKGIFYGEKGYMIVENINNPNAIDVYDIHDVHLKHIDLRHKITGYEYEVQECIDCMKKGLIESESMPLHKSIEIMELMDYIRMKWNLIYPKETK